MRAGLPLDMDDEGSPAVLRNPEAKVWEVLVDDSEVTSSDFPFAESAANGAFVDGCVDAHGSVSVVCYLGHRPFRGNRTVLLNGQRFPRTGPRHRSGPAPAPRVRGV